MRIETDVTRLLGIDLPIIQAGMSWASSSPALPLAVSRAGGLGVIAAGPMRLSDLEAAVAAVRAGTDASFAVNLPLYRQGVEEAIELLLELRPPVLVASQGGPARYLEGFQEAGVTCLHVVASEEHAVMGAEAGVDGLVVVGAEAGGHPPPSGVTSLVILRAIARALPGFPIVASGGFADGASLLAALSLGAGAAQFGSRFLLSEEASVHPAYKEMVLGIGVDGTRLVGRGLGVIRAAGNDFTARMDELEAAGADLDERRREFTRGTLKMAALEGNVRDGKVEAGQSAGIVDSILPAAEIVASIVAEYQDAANRVPLIKEDRADVRSH
ncbi:MAG TPA: nitronate monooxygenase family protein [Solirubrobacterales bacterium]